MYIAHDVDICPLLLLLLAVNPHVEHNNYFYGGFINFFFFTIETILIRSNVFCKHIFIYYKNNHKCNIGIIINHEYKFCRIKMKTIQFFSEIQKAS